MLLGRHGAVSVSGAPKNQYDVRKDFGAKGDGRCDDTKPVQAAIDAALNAGTSVYIPRGTYRITSPLILNIGTYDIDAALRIDSDWATLQASTLGPNASSQPLPSPVAIESVINITIASHLTINRLLIDGNNGTAQYGIRAFKVSGAQARIEQVTVQGARSHGFLLEGCQVSYWQHLITQSNGGDGLYCRGCNGASFTHLTAQDNQGHGIRIEGYQWTNAKGSLERYSGGAYLSAFSSESNTGDGVNIGPGNLVPANQVTGASIRDGWLESNAGDGINISAPNTLVDGLRIVSYQIGGRAVRVRATGLGAVVRGIRSGGNGNYSDHYNRILVEADAKSSDMFSFDSNFNMYSVSAMEVEYTPSNRPTKAKTDDTGEHAFGKLAGGRVSGTAELGPAVTLSPVQDRAVIMDNGIVAAAVNVSTSNMLNYTFLGTQLLEVQRTAANSGHIGTYFSANSGHLASDDPGTYWTPSNCSFHVEVQTSEMVEIVMSASSPDFWNHEFHFILRRGDHGLYIYVVLNHSASSPAARMDEYRMTWWPRLLGDNASDPRGFFDRVIIDRARNWVQPSDEEIGDTNVPGGPKEVTKILSGPWAGKLYCKYMYSADYEKIGTWGMSSELHNRSLWAVFGSFEGMNDGPSKNDLTQYLIHFQRDHYAGSAIQVDEGQEWSKVYGPFLLYANALPSHEEQWEDAKKQYLAERAAWPYSWVGHPLYQARNRTVVTGRLHIKDALKPRLTGADAWVGLAPPTNTSAPMGGGWQNQGQDYEYWVRADGDGRFRIAGVRPATYTLYAWTAGVVRELAVDGVEVGSTAQDLGDVTLEVPRAANSVIVWEVGVPNRDTAEFYHGYETTADWWTPMNFLRFPSEFSNPLRYNAHSCEWARAINYAQSRYFSDNPTNGSGWMWLFEFDLAEVSGDAQLTVAFASQDATLMVYVNQDYEKEPDRPAIEQRTGLADDVLVREGSHGKYQWYNFSISRARLRVGKNVFGFSAASSSMGAKVSLMYDYVSLEMPVSNKVRAGHCWDENPGWGADVFLSPSIDSSASQHCRPNVVYFDECVSSHFCPQTNVTRVECAKYCVAQGRCAVYTSNAASECYLRASANDPRGDSPDHGSVSCPTSRSFGAIH